MEFDVKKTDEWKVEEEDEAIYNFSDQKGLWQPKPEDILSMFEKLAKGEALPLQWTCPGRRAPESDKVEEKVDIQQMDVDMESKEADEKEPEPCAFDFDDTQSEPGMKSTPMRAFGGLNRTPRTEKRVARMDNIMDSLRKQQMQRAAEREARRAKQSPARNNQAKGRLLKFGNSPVPSPKNTSASDTNITPSTSPAAVTSATTPHIQSSIVSSPLTPLTPSSGATSSTPSINPLTMKTSASNPSDNKSLDVTASIKPESALEKRAMDIMGMINPPASLATNKTIWSSVPFTNNVSTTSPSNLTPKIDIAISTSSSISTINSSSLTTKPTETIALSSAKLNQNVSTPIPAHSTNIEEISSTNIMPSSSAEVPLPTNTPPASERSSPALTLNTTQTTSTSSTVQNIQLQSNTIQTTPPNFNETHTSATTAAATTTPSHPVVEHTSIDGAPSTSSVNVSVVSPTPSTNITTSSLPQVDTVPKNDVSNAEITPATIETETT